MIALQDPRLPARFWAKVLTAPTGCWEWQGYRGAGGYGRYRLGDSMQVAHRVAYICLVGPIPDGLHVLHSCDNPPCVNPAHLRVGTREDNMRDCVQRGRHSNGNAAKTHCKRGHPYDDANTYLNPRGERECRICRGMARERSRRRNIAANPPLAHRLHSPTRKEKP